MAKKSSSKGSSGKAKSKGPGGLSADDHRKASAELHAKARLHDAKADLMDAKNPPKNKPNGLRGCY